MNMHKVLKNGIVVLALAAVSVGGGVTGFADIAFAKDGNGGGGGNGGGNGNGGGRDSASSNSRSGAHNHSGKTRSESAKLGSGKERVTKDANRQVAKATPAAKVKPIAKPAASELAGLNSLQRNYHAYLNSSDPRMASLSAYVTAYAQYELTNGIDPAVTDPELGEVALRDALEDFSGAPVNDATFSWAQDVLGVGPSVGKIDEIRDDLSAEATTED